MDMESMFYLTFVFLAAIGLAILLGDALVHLIHAKGGRIKTFTFSALALLLFIPICNFYGSGSISSAMPTFLFSYALLVRSVLMKRKSTIKTKVCSIGLLLLPLSIVALPFVFSDSAYSLFYEEITVVKLVYIIFIVALIFLGVVCFVYLLRRTCIFYAEKVDNPRDGNSPRNSRKMNIGIAIGAGIVTLGLLSFPLWGGVPVSNPDNEYDSADTTAEATNPENTWPIYEPTRPYVISNIQIGAADSPIRITDLQPIDSIYHNTDINGYGDWAFTTGLFGHYEFTVDINEKDKDKLLKDMNLVVYNKMHKYSHVTSQFNTDGEFWIGIGDDYDYSHYDCEFVISHHASELVIAPEYSAYNGFYRPGIESSPNNPSFSFDLSENGEPIPIYFDDSNLENAIRETLDIWDREITIEDALGVTALVLSDKNVGSTAALSCFKDLIHLDLSNNQIYDIDSLSGLTNLISLDLSTNRLGDISPLSGLINISELHLSNNEISDISALSSLNNLTILYLDGNPINDYSPVASIYDQLTSKDFKLTSRPETTNTNVYKKIPILVRNLSDGLTTEISPGTVTLTLTAAPSVISMLEPTDFAAYVDLNGLGTGTYTVSINFELPNEFNDPTVWYELFKDCIAASVTITRD